MLLAFLVANESFLSKNHGQQIIFAADETGATAQGALTTVVNQVGMQAIGIVGLNWLLIGLYIWISGVIIWNLSGATAAYSGQNDCVRQR